MLFEETSNPHTKHNVENRKQEFIYSSRGHVCPGDGSHVTDTAQDSGNEWAGRGKLVLAKGGGESRQTGKPGNSRISSI